MAQKQRNFAANEFCQELPFPAGTQVERVPFTPLDIENMVRELREESMSRIRITGPLTIMKVCKKKKKLKKWMQLMSLGFLGEDAPVEEDHPREDDPFCNGVIDTQLAGCYNEVLNFEECPRVDSLLLMVAVHYNMSMDRGCVSPTLRGMSWPGIFYISDCLMDWNCSTSLKKQVAAESNRAGKAARKTNCSNKVIRATTLQHQITM